MELGLAGRVAVVTGGSKGIGRSTAERLLSEGGCVVVVARDASFLAGVVSELRRLSTQVLGVSADVNDPASTDHIRDAAFDRFGQIDIVVNNAGGSGGTHQRLIDFDEDTWMDVYRLNVVSALRLTLACIPSMTERGWGRVVNVASTAARLADPRFAPYGAAKAALLHATQNLAQAFSEHGVLVNCVLPGLTRTDGVLAGYERASQELGRTSSDIERRMLERQPAAIGRAGDPTEVADAIAFLCSDRASWITGALLAVDGGTIRCVP